MSTTPEEQILAKEAQVIADKVENAGDKAAKEARSEGLSESEVNEKVQKARQEEKNKLYPQLEELKASLKEVQETLRAEREEKEQLRKEAEEKAERQRVAKMSEQERANELLAKLEEQLKEEREERVRFKRELESHRRQEGLDRYRRNLLNKYSGQIIPEMVTGSSEEELDRAVLRAKARYEELVGQIRQEAGAKVRRGLSSTNPDTEALEEQELEQTIGFDEKKYRQKGPEGEEYRRRIKDQVADAYRKSMGR